MSKQLYEKENNNLSPFFPLVRLEDIIETITDKSLHWILANYNHIYLEFESNVKDTRDTVPQVIRRSGLWVTYHNGKRFITEVYIGDNKNVYDEWSNDENWEAREINLIPNESILPQHLSPALKQLIKEGKNITNLPDEEDLTTDGFSIKFKDREYNSYSYSGLGKIILRKNVVLIEDKYKNVLTRNMLNEYNTIYEIRYDFDLNNENIVIPENCILYFNGGSLINGTITGNNTNILASKYNIFKNISITGSWNINDIYSNWFDFKEEKVDNISNFRNMMILADSPNLSNVYIKKGVWWTSCHTEINGEYHSTIGIKVPSNTHIHNGATIRQLPNSYEKTAMFHIENVENVTIEGGTLIGDVVDHTGITGEWGIGIYPVGSKNIIIRNIEIKEFWGDGIDIQSLYSDYENQTSIGHCKNILIDNVRCLNNRRQGLSVEAIDGLIVRDSEFSGTGSIKYTGPGAGIDIEPWHQWQILSNITIENCILNENKSEGLLIHLPSAFNQVHNIRILNCESDKGIWTKNVNGLYVDNFIAKGNKSYLCLFNKGKDIHISNSSFKNEIYLNGDLENITISRCIFNMMSTNNWNGFGIYVENSDSNKYININFKHCELKFNDKLRAMHSNSMLLDINFIDCKIETSSKYAFPIGYGDFIHNEVILHEASAISFKNRKQNTINITDNNFYLYHYTQEIITFDDTTSIVNDTILYDYILLNNNINSIGGFWEPFGGAGKNIVKNRLYNNLFDVDIYHFVPAEWSYRNHYENIEFYYREKTNVLRTNIGAGNSAYIRVPYKRSSLKISLINKYTTIRTLITSETTVNINPDLTSGLTVSHYTSFKMPIQLDSSYKTALPVFATEVKDEYVYIYINNNTNQAKLFTIHAELLTQTEYKGEVIKFGSVVIPDLDFKLNILSPCYSDTLSLGSHIGLYKGFTLIYNNKIIVYNGTKWVDANGNEINYLIKGPTSNRPNVVNGTFYYDTTLNKPIWKCENIWIDSNGNEV